MCISLPMQVIEARGRHALCRYGEEIRTVDMILVGEQPIGAWILVFLDAARDVGLLYQAKDTCGFYQHRSWKKAAPIVNQETTFAHIMGQMISAGVAAAQAAGMRIEDISDPATKNYNLIHVDKEEGSG